MGWNLAALAGSILSGPSVTGGFAEKRMPLSTDIHPVVEIADALASGGGAALSSWWAALAGLGVAALLHTHRRQPVVQRTAAQIIPIRTPL